MAMGKTSENSVIFLIKPFKANFWIYRLLRRIPPPHQIVLRVRDDRLFCWKTSTLDPFSIAAPGDNR